MYLPKMSTIKTTLLKNSDTNSFKETKRGHEDKNAILDN